MGGCNKQAGHKIFGLCPHGRFPLTPATLALIEGDGVPLDVAAV